jgi:hypothetical protein
MKYIVFENRMPVLFPRYIEHFDMAKLIGREATSAGFVQSLGGELRAYGRSESLDLNSNPGRDTQLLKINSERVDIWPPGH